MESNWRFNVWNYGMWGSDWELCARVLNPFPGFTVLMVKRSGHALYEMYAVGSDQFPVGFGYAMPVGSFPGNAAGWIAEPD